MARKATRSDGTKKAKKSASRPKTRAVAVRSASGGNRSSGFDASEAFIKLLQSPLVAELVAVAATAALTALAQHGVSGGDQSRGKKAGNAVKAAGKAAASAVGRRLSTEMDEIRNAAKAAKSGAKA
jgi:hypothetical protein